MFSSNSKYQENERKELEKKYGESDKKLDGLLEGEYFLSAFKTYLAITERYSSNRKQINGKLCAF